MLRENTRKEFEQARYEQDPQMISRMLIVGRDSLTKTLEKVTHNHLFSSLVLDCRKIINSSSTTTKYFIPSLR
jgi:hypothetical protein